jgi:pantoate--beta-alanine ligase
MDTVKTIQQTREAVAAARKQGKSIGLVPTMGALHKGHGSLIEKCRSECGFVVVSIFVNPTQFGPAEDLAKYPRTVEQDILYCKTLGADLLFAPQAQEMYPPENLTLVDVEKITNGLCGVFRPGHFRGVATVCAKLFNIVCPDIAYFGQKDAQQVVVVRRMAEDLNFPLQIRVCPTVREPDGLAASSRNRYLDSQQRNDALCLYHALKACSELVRSGNLECGRLVEAMCKVIRKAPLAGPEYITIVHPDTLAPLKRIESRALVVLAVRIGDTRLIDNILIDLNNPQIMI